ncbi:MAG: M20/M25/M40 family metallo-hydrolase [Myxococcota bacterium]
MLWLLGCTAPPSAPAPLALSVDRVRDDVDWLASDALGGRVPGTPGHDLAVDGLAERMAAAGLQPADAYAHRFPLTLDRLRYGLGPDGAVFEVPAEQQGVDLLGLLPGTDPVAADEVVLLVAHYDHLGVTAEGDVYNGAFDDAVAVCALLELARALRDRPLPRTVGFLLTDAEEDGLDGALAAVAEPVVPLDRVVAAVGIDPIGRPVLPDFGPLFVIGAERSPALAAAVAAVDADTTEVRRLSRTPVVGYGSDAEAFWDDAGVPSLWLTSGGMSFYHTVDDDPLTIDYRSVDAHLGALAALTVALADPAVHPVDLGPQPLSAGDLEEAVRILDGALASSVLTEAERALGEGYRATLAEGVRDGDPVGPDAGVAYASLLLYVIQELTPAHPGPIPPPYP